MADWYPGAWKINQGGNGNRITARPANNIFHIAASNWNIKVDNPTQSSGPGSGIAGWNASASACNGYIDEFGNMQQYCSVFDAVNGTSFGNWRNRTWESWNPEGLTGSTEQYNSSLWTDAQIERFADLLAWDHRENGALLQNMKNSLPSSWGVGVHRYGVSSAGPMSRVSGGESWTAHPGKPCPGTARVYQLDRIIARAQQIVNNGWGTLPPGRIQFPLRSGPGDTSTNTNNTESTDWWETVNKDEAKQAVAEAVAGVLGREGRIDGLYYSDVVKDSWSRTKSLEAKVDALTRQLTVMQDNINKIGARTLVNIPGGVKGEPSPSEGYLVKNLKPAVVEAPKAQ